MNQGGQEGAGFRLLIEAVLVAFILVIILGVISQIDSWRWVVSEQRLFEGFDKALNSPDGSLIVESDLVLKGGSKYSSRAFAASVAGISNECIEIDASGSSAFHVTDSKIIEITTLLETDIYYKCLPGDLVGEAACKIFCTVSFGKEIEAS